MNKYKCIHKVAEWLNKILLSYMSHVKFVDYMYTQFNKHIIINFGTVVLVLGFVSCLSLSCLLFCSFVSVTRCVRL